MNAPFRFWLLWFVAMLVVGVNAIYITMQFNRLLMPDQQVEVLKILALDPRPKFCLLNQEIVIPVDRWQLERSLERLEHQLKTVAKSL